MDTRPVPGPPSRSRRAKGSFPDPRGDSPATRDLNRTAPDWCPGRFLLLVWPALIRQHQGISPTLHSGVCKFKTAALACGLRPARARSSLTEALQEFPRPSLGVQIADQILCVLAHNVVGFRVRSKRQERAFPDAHTVRHSQCVQPPLQGMGVGSRSRGKTGALSGGSERRHLLNCLTRHSHLTGDLSL
jgi:hypothetical protein